MQRSKFRKLQKKERSTEHVNIVLTDLDGIDKKIGLVLNKFISLWRLSACKPTYKDSKEEELYLNEIINEIEEKRRILIEWSNKIRVGK